MNLASLINVTGMSMYPGDLLSSRPVIVSIISCVSVSRSTIEETCHLLRYLKVVFVFWSSHFETQFFTSACYAVLV